MKITVEDTGIGISDANQKKLFKVFGYVDDKSAMNAKGIGLGLVISERITKMFNGEMSLQSILGEGSKFSFTF